MTGKSAWRGLGYQFCILLAGVSPSVLSAIPALQRPEGGAAGYAAEFVRATRNPSPSPAVHSAPASTVAKAQSAIAVVYPDSGEPFDSAFTQIIKGIEAQTQAPVIRLSLSADLDSCKLKHMLARQEARVVIALGRKGMQVADTLQRNLGVVVGGVVTVPEHKARNLHVISLSPDPALLFARLKSLVPSARRIITIHDPRQNAWLMRLAQQAARRLGLELIVHNAEDLRAAVRLYQAVFSSADGTHDALWLPHDNTTVENGTVLPLVLQESWEHSLPVFSSNPDHIRRGVLFTLYPDNQRLGRSLAGLALGLAGDRHFYIPNLAPLRDVLLGVNLRAAQHLGLRFSREQQRGFDLTFP